MTNPNMHITWVLILAIVICSILLGCLIYRRYSQHYPYSKRSRDSSLPRALLVVRNYNLEAGLHWKLNNVLLASHYAHLYDLKLVVIFDAGLYLETDKTHQEEYEQHIDPDYNEWFSYYFDPIGSDDPEIRRLWKQGALDRLPSFSFYSDPTVADDVLGWTWDRAAFVKHEVTINFHEEWKRALHLKPYLKQQIREFSDKHFKNKFLIGAHIRGTDKFPDAHGHENHPKHFTYEQYCDALEKEYRKQRAMLGPTAQIAIFCASDEQPFIDFASHRLRDFGFVHAGPGILRSSISTSGLELQSHLCGGGTEDKHPDCKQYRALAKASVHRGRKDASNYKKGWDALYEVSLLAQSDVFYRSRGNFSTSAIYLNPNMKVVDMAEEL